MLKYQFRLDVETIVGSILMVILILTFYFIGFADALLSPVNDEWHCIEYQSDNMIKLKVFRDEKNEWIGFSSCQDLVNKLMTNGSGFQFLDREDKNNYNRITGELVNTYESWVLIK